MLINHPNWEGLFDVDHCQRKRAGKKVEEKIFGFLRKLCSPAAQKKTFDEDRQGAESAIGHPCHRVQSQQKKLILDE